MLLDLQIALVLFIGASIMFAESRASTPHSRYDQFTWASGWFMFAAALIFTLSGIING